LIAAARRPEPEGEKISSIIHIVKYNILLFFD